MSLKKFVKKATNVVKKAATSKLVKGLAIGTLGAIAVGSAFVPGAGAGIAKIAGKAKGLITKVSASKLVTGAKNMGGNIKKAITEVQQKSTSFRSTSPQVPNEYSPSIAVSGLQNSPSQSKLSKIFGGNTSASSSASTLTASKRRTFLGLDISMF